MLAADQLHVPHLIDSEVASGLRRRVAGSLLPADTGWNALNAWRHLAMTRYPMFTLLDRVWQLRDNVSAYDASYITLAELLDCNLLTADARLGSAPGIQCAITIVPR